MNGILGLVLALGQAAPATDGQQLAPAQRAGGRRVVPAVASDQAKAPRPARAAGQAAPPAASEGGAGEGAAVDKRTPPAWITGEQPAPAAAPLDLPKLALRMFVATIAVLATAAASIYLGRQWLDRRHPAAVSGRQLRVVETRNVSPRATLQLVDAGGQLVLVGVDSHGIKAMVPLAAAFDVAWDAAQAPAAEDLQRSPQPFAR